MLSQLAAMAVIGPLQVDVMTFNIRFATANDGANSWPNRRDHALEIMRRGEYDFIGLQEALASQLDEIEKTIPDAAIVGVGRDDGRTAGEHSSIVFRRSVWRVDRAGTFWLSDTPDVIASKSWGNRITRICTWARFVRRSGHAVWVYNMHWDHESAAANLKSASLVARRIRHRGDDAPVIVMGDFNEGEASPALAALKGEAGLTDTFRALHPKETEVTTFTDFDPNAKGGAKIDHIFVGPGWKIQEARIIRELRQDRWPSDHHPVTARLQLDD